MDCKGTQFFGNTIYMHIFFSPFYSILADLQFFFIYKIIKIISISYAKFNNRFVISTIAASNTTGE